MEQTHMNVKLLQKLLECPEKAAYGTLGNSGAYAQKRIFLHSCLDLLKKSMLEQKNAIAWEQNLNSLFFKSYRPGWFDLEQEYEQERKNDFGRMLRLGNYLLSLPVMRCISDAPYFAELPETLFCHGSKFSAISGKADLILFHQDGTTEILCFALSEPKYSYAARQEANSPSYAIELLAFKLGFESRYPGFKASLFYLKNKDDSAGNLKPYENNRGKNIISFDFKEMDILENFRRSISFPAKRNCKKCRYETLCSIPPLPKEQGANPGSLKTDQKENRQQGHTYTKAQQEVIFHKNGPLNCIAVPGAGKTACLVRRMLFLMEEGVKPEHILFVTFTQKAAREIKARAKRELELSGKAGDRLPNIYTFNGLGYQILKENPVILGRRVKLASRIDRLRLIREILKKVHIQGMSYSGIYLPYGLIPALEKHFERIESSGEEVFRNSFHGKDPEGILAAYHEYQKEFQKRELVTYDMQVSLCNQLLKNQELASIYARAFRYIMVDEFQDVSADNAQMVYTIAKHHNNLVVVGDDDQSIYGFRGGSNHFMLHFSEEFPSAKTVMMEDNFRSGKEIANAALNIIGKNTERFQKKIIAHREIGKSPILLQEFPEYQLPMLIDQILRMGYGYGDIAILARFNKTLFKAKNALSPGIRCTNPKDYVINDITFIAIADVLELCFFGMEDMPLYRLFKIQGIDLKQEMQINQSVIDCLSREGISDIGLSNPEPAQKSGKKAWQKAMRNIHMAMRNVRQAKTMPELIQGILNAIFHLEHHPIIKILESLCDERAISSGLELFSLMRDMELFSDQTRIKYEPKADEVRLLTAHDSKGMEFPVVILLALDEFDDTEEERRLLYVAFTRAKELLIITKSPYAMAKILPDIKICQLTGGKKWN